AIILLYGGKLVLADTGELSAAAFIGYIALFSQVMRPAKALTDSFANIHSGIAAGEQVLDLIDQKNEIPDAPDARPFTEFNQGISLSNITFAYGDRQVLKNVSLEIPKGKTIALVGPSGGGKSTLMDLIPRFIEAQQGEV